MPERQDIKAPIEPDMKFVLPVATLCAIGGFIGSTAALEFARQSGLVATELLNPPVSLLFQMTATGWSELLGIGVGCSISRLIATGEI